MCEFCENEKIIEFDNGKETWNIQNTEKCYEMLYANHETGKSKGITIRYCPICGRNLTDEEKVSPEDRIAKLNDRHQSDCIKINQLQTTIDVLVDKLARLREVHGL